MLAFNGRAIGNFRPMIYFVQVVSKQIMHITRSLHMNFSNTVKHFSTPLLNNENQ